MTLPPIIALIGKVGHGKTRVLNKLTGSNRPSNMGSKSCTTEVQFGYTKSGVAVVDTAGFCSSQSITAHLAAQKIALGNFKLSGVYVVVKCGRADEISETLDKIMDVVGSDDLRVIITHEDVAKQLDGFNAVDLTSTLSSLVRIPTEHILIVGKDTEGELIESFVNSTMHEPREFQVTDEHIAKIADLSSCSRRYNKPINEAQAKVAAATTELQNLVRFGKSYESDCIVLVVQKITTDAVDCVKEEIFRNVFAENLCEDETNLIYAKAGLALSLTLKDFIDTTNAYLSYDVTDSSNPLNEYKKCNYCDAVYVKIVGCNHITCGDVAPDYKRPRPLFTADFRKSGDYWTIPFFWQGTEVDSTSNLLEKLRSFSQNNRVTEWGGKTSHRKRANAVFDSGCGAELDWSKMRRLTPEELQCLKDVQMRAEDQSESAVKASFQDQLSRHEERNRLILQGILDGDDQKMPALEKNDGVRRGNTGLTSKLEKNP